VGCEGMPVSKTKEGGVMTMNKLGTRHRFGIYDSDKKKSSEKKYQSYLDNNISQNPG
jgi:hypothetical protein